MKTTKLSLSRETVRALHEEQLRMVDGLSGVSCPCITNPQTNCPCQTIVTCANPCNFTGGGATCD